MMIKFDLQRFGKDSGGKGGGKILLTALGFLMGGFYGAILGAVLGSLIWGRKKNKDNQSSVIRFDRYQESMTSGGSVPIVYGVRKMSGNQTFHETNADSNTLYKHIVFCEGDIEGITGICANGLLIPTGNQTEGTVMTVQNTKYENARIEYKGQDFVMYWNGNTKKLWFPSKEQMQKSDDAYWEWQMSISSLISFINRIGDGWEAFPTSTTNAIPAEMKFAPHLSESKSLGYANWTDLSAANKAKLNKGETVTIYNNGRSNSNKAQYTRYVPLTYDEAMGATGGGFDWNGKVAILFGFVGAYIWIITVNEDNTCYMNPLEFTCNTVRGGTTYTYHDGDLPNNYERVGSYSKMAWLDMTFVVSNELNGNPSVDGIVHGKKVLDTRTGEYALSTNPAMCLRDFLLAERYGLGRWISEADLDEQSFKDAADYCDGMIQFARSDGSTVLKKRFELNMIIDERQPAWDWISSMLGCFQAFLAINQGKIFLYIEKASPVVYSFDTSNIWDLKISSTSLEETPNQYKIKFIDPKNEWKAVVAEVNDYADQKERGKIVIQEVELEGVTSQDQALRLGRFYRDFNFVSSFNITFKTGFQAMGLSCGDVVNVTYKKVFVNMPFRIIEMKETSEHEFEITCRPYNESIYNDSLGANLIAYNYSQMKPLIGKPTTPTNLAVRQDYYVDDVGGEHSTYTLSWGASQYLQEVVYRVYIKNGEHWDFLAETPECKYTGIAVVGRTYQFGIAAISGNKSSDYAFSSEITITGKNEPPSEVTNLQVYYDEGIRATWMAPSDPDIRYYKVTVNGGALNVPSTVCFSSAVHGTNTVSVVTVDNAGNESEPVSASIYCDLAPSPVRGVKAVNQGGYIVLTWDTSNNATAYRIEGSTKATAYGNTYIMPATSEGTFTFQIRATNEYGVSSPTSITVNVTDTNQIKPIQEINLFDLTDIYYDSHASSDYLFKDFDCKMKEMTETGSRYGMYIVKDI